MEPTWVAGAVIGIAVVLLLRGTRLMGQTRCPACREIVSSRASVCAHCGSDLASQVADVDWSTHRQCPYCAEVIRREANVCRFCDRRVGPAPEPEMPHLCFCMLVKGDHDVRDHPA